MNKIKTRFQNEIKCILIHFLLKKCNVIHTEKNQLKPTMQSTTFYFNMLNCRPISPFSSDFYGVRKYHFKIEKVIERATKIRNY